MDEKLHTKFSNVGITHSYPDLIKFIDEMDPSALPGPSFIKPDQLDPLVQGSTKKRSAVHSHRTQNLVTVGTKLLTGEWFSFDPWSMDQADLVW